MKTIIRTLLILVLFLSCNDAKTTQTNNEDVIHKGVVQEVLNVKGYSYVRLLEDGQDVWLAAPTTNIEKGGTYYYGKTMEMKNFSSKELNKTFETLYFIEKISTSEADVKSPLTTNPHDSSMVPNQVATPDNSPKPVIDKKEVNVTTEENTISLAELFKNKDTYNNTVVRVRGEVTKYNPAIMKINWLHVQDGTEFNGEFDLTVTTSSEVQVGDVVTLEGKVTLNKDFGAGYTYNIIIENATVIK